MVVALPEEGFVSASRITFVLSFVARCGLILVATSATAGELEPADAPVPDAAVPADLAAARPRPLPMLTGGVLHLAWIDPVDAADRCAGGAREETTRVFKAMGIATQWRRAEAGERAREGEIRVILLDRAARTEGGNVVLGATPPRFEAQPFVWVHVPSVREGLRLVRSSIATLDVRDQYRLAIALGRVIAHEVVHAVAPAIPHGQGLMAARLTARDLGAPALPVTPEVAQVVRAALSGEVLPAASAGVGLLAVEHAGREPDRQ